jgi:hypothetical protein
MVEVGRRAVLGAALGAVGLAVVGVDAPAADAATALPRRSHYAKSVGRGFMVTRSKQSHSVKLTRIRNVARTPASKRDACFNLIFAVSGNVHLPDGIYTVTRKGVPTQQLFLSRVGDGPNMQALVNRSV